MSQRHTIAARRKARRLAPYRRLEADLKAARKACENAVDAYVEAITALGDAIRFLDHQTGEGWTAADSLRLKEIRELACAPLKK